MAAIIGILHYVYAGVYGTINDISKNTVLGLDPGIYDSLFGPPIGYFVIAGTSVILINVYYILLLT